MSRFCASLTFIVEFFVKHKQWRKNCTSEYLQHVNYYDKFNKNQTWDGKLKTYITYVKPKK
jgi:hypothetical protein